MAFEFQPSYGQPAPVDESVVLKNWAKWWHVEAVGRFALPSARRASGVWSERARCAERGGLVPMKMPYRGTDRHATNHTVDSLREAFPVTLIVDLQSDGEAYALDSSVCRRVRLVSRSKAAPARELVDQFIALVEPHVRAGRHAAVHCHYGFNRTGFLCAAYLIECHGYSPDAAIDEFVRVRPPGIKHEHFKDELRARYGGRLGAGRRWLRRLARAPAALGHVTAVAAVAVAAAALLFAAARSRAAKS